MGFEEGHYWLRKLICYNGCRWIWNGHEYCGAEWKE